MSIKEYLANEDKVALATKILYIVVGIGVVRTIFTIFRHIDVRSPESLVITKLIVYGMSVFLIIQISKCKNWARWALVVILTVSIPLTILPAYGQAIHNPIFAILFLLQLILYIIALVLLFQESVSERFKS